MPLNFPLNPVLNQTYTFASKTWIWNGSGWALKTLGAINNIPVGNVTPSTGGFTALTATSVSATGNVTGGNVVTAGQVSAGGNVTGSNVVTAGQVSATGNVSGNFILGNGSLLTGITTTYGNANVAAYLPTYTGNLNPGNLTSNGNVSGANLITAGQISAAGNVTGNYILGNGALLTGLPATYSNANVAAYLPTYSGNIGANNITATGLISTTGNVRGAFILGDGGFLSNITVSSNVAVSQIANGSTVLSVVGANGNLVATVNGISNVVVITPTGAEVTGNLIPTANVTYNLGSPTRAWNDLYLSGNTIYLNDSTISANTTAFTLTTPSGGSTVIQGGGTITPYGNSNVAAYLPTYTGNLASLQGNVTTTANISGQFILGNGAFLTGITAGTSYANANVADYLASGTVTSNIITSGNVSGGNIIGNGSALTNLTGANVTGTVAAATTAGTVTTNAQPNITSVGTLSALSVSGNIVSGAGVGGNILRRF